MLCTSESLSSSMADKIHDSNLSIRERMEALVRLKQKEITDGLAALDTTTFHTDAWVRGNNGGGGESMVLQDGTTFEKGGVNISIVHGKLPPQAVQRMRADHRNLKGAADGSVDFFACGLSMVIHPTTRMLLPPMPTTDTSRPPTQTMAR